MECLRTNTAGSILVEVMLSSTILLLISMYVVATIFAGRDSVATAGLRAQAAALAEEGAEATRNMRDADFLNLANGTYGLSTAGNEWGFSGTSDVTDEFTRSIVIANGPDANTKLVTSTVTWQQNSFRAGSLSVVTYLGNWLIAKASGGDWSNPSIKENVNFPGTSAARRIRIHGNYAYVAISGGTPNFRIFDISDPDSIVYLGGTTITGTPNDIAISGNYAFVPGSANTAELSVVNITNPANPSVVATLNLTGAHDGRSIVINGTIAYLTRLTGTSNEFFVINIANPLSPSVVTSANINGSGFDLVLNEANTYAYVISDSDTQELQVFNITNPATASWITSLNLSGTQDAVSMRRSGTNLFIGRAGGLFTVISIANPTAPTQTTQINTSSTVWDLTLNGDATRAFLAQAGTTHEFQVVDISNPATPSIIGSVDTPNILYGIGYHAGNDLCYAVGAQNDSEMIIFQPGP